MYRQAGVISLTGIPILRETYAPILLHRKMVRLQKSASPNTTTYTTPFAGSSVPTSILFKRAIVRPMKMLIFSPSILILSVYVAVTYGYLYFIYSTITFVFEKQYHFSPGTVGLSFMGIGTGMTLGLITFGIFSDKLMKERADKAAASAASSAEGNVETAGELKPEYRLYLMIPTSFAVPIGLFWYGWSAEKRVHWIMSMIGTALFGFGMVGTYVRCQPLFASLLSLQPQNH
jgi:MFS family permease